MTLGSSLLVDLSDLHHTQVRPLALSDEAVPPEGSVLLAVERFGFSANNVTYANVGEAMGYWSFFPAPDGHGQIPVWGHARVVRSGHPGVAEGAEVYGFLPMATHLLVAPSAVDVRGFTDGSPHRAARAAVYNRYLLRSVDPFAAASPGPELEAVLRPLFTTSFLLEADLAQHDYHGADAVVVTSASSRTALGTAHLIATRSRRPALVGLTRADHVADTQAVGCYDRVLAYDDVPSLPIGTTTVLDLSGDGAVVADLHHRLGDALVHSSIVGATHWQAEPVDTAGLPGAPRTFFFAPEAAERLRETAGPAAVESALVAGWRSFAEVMSGWLRIRTGTGPDQVADAYRATLAGTASPRDALVLSMRT
ncbi:DUF2855 family protein [Dermatobacter hominis]|uniref:DUF2855 family protein n=1 Tax=Dermatobacter hominis TaxID=2884263 RepID=UPI001D0FB8D1|nr:DUF2855 family protein [Dermatobacter hominis]UDY36518.1 DUF2855 family protein [Dermatobacter hominis]